MTAVTPLPEPTTKKPTTLFDAHALVEEKLAQPVHLLEVFTETEPEGLWEDTYGSPNLTPAGWALVDGTVCELLGAAAEALANCFWGTPHKGDDCTAFLRRASDTVALCSAAAVACREEDTAGLIGAETCEVLRIVYERLEPLYREARKA